MKLWLDLETRSPIPIKRGVALYSTKVQIIMAQWAIDDGPVTVEDLTGSPPPSPTLLKLARQADEIWAHGAEFEQHALDTVPWWRRLDVSPNKFRCTMALARMHGLPGGLEKLSEIFKLPPELAKDKRGHELIQIFCIPKKDGSYYDRSTHPLEWDEFLHYGGMDIHAMRAVWTKCPKWNSTPRMWAFWHLDQRMNKRGVAMDLKLCQGAVNATTKGKSRLKEQVAEATLGELEIAATQRDKLIAYMRDYGVHLPDLKADTVERRLEDESLPEHIKELLRIRQQASKASTAKYQRALNQHVNGRLRNLLVFCGASRTGRWAGRTLQPQNLPRPKHKPWQIALAIELFCDGTINECEWSKDDVMGLASSCLRGMIIAEPGRRLVISDLANVEGRYMAWIAGELWKLEAFSRYDRKEGPDLYKVAYARAFNIDPDDIADEGDDRRQIGKVMELALQYYGGVGAFCAMAETYGLRLEKLADAAWPVIPEATKLEARKAWSKAVKRNRTYGLEERIWTVCHALVLLWRAAHPAITKFWENIDKAVRCAIAAPNKKFRVGQLVIDREGNWLRVLLPSGRYLSYPAPRLDGEWSGDSFMGVDPYTKQWKRITTYSGKRAENIVQGGCADLLMDGLLAADEADYNPVLSVHDEALTEPVDDDRFNDKELSKLLVSSSLWADGLPLAAKGKTAYRYAK